MNKKTIIDVAICLVLAIVIGVEIKVGFNMLQDKWTYDTDMIMAGAKEHGAGIAVLEDVFSWQETDYPDEGGDVVQIGANHYQIDGVSTDTEASKVRPNQINYAHGEEKTARLLQYELVTSKDQVEAFHNGLAAYFQGDSSTLINLLPTNVIAENVTEMQQSFMDGAIPVIYDTGTGNYYLFLDCGENEYDLVYAPDPVIVTDAKLTPHYRSISQDPMTEHKWSTYEAGAIDNTRAKLLDADANSLGYTQTGTTSSSDMINPDSYSVDSQGTAYMDQSSTSTSEDVYGTEEAALRRSRMVEAGQKGFDETGKATDGSTSVDLTSEDAKASRWELTATEYKYVNNGLGISGLSGRRTSSLFEVNGTISNIMPLSRQWVMQVIFMNEDKMVGMKVIDSRTDPIAADGTTTFNVSITPDDNIDFKSITAIIFNIY